MLLDARQTAAVRRPQPLPRSYAEAVPASLRRHFGAAAPPMPDLPPELAFLALAGVGATRLAVVARAAAAAGVTGDAQLFAGGVSDETYYRHLARHLRVPFLERALPLGCGFADLASAAETGVARLAQNRQGLHHVVAPRGIALRAMLRDHAALGPGLFPFAVTTPRRFEALVRRHDRAGFAVRAADGLADWDSELSARRTGLGHGRLPARVAGIAALSLFLAAPKAVAIGAALLLSLLFSIAVLQRLIATAASPAPCEPRDPGTRTPDRALPVYTILVPLFREARILEKLVSSLDAIDYPPSKLDIRILLEEVDRDTIAAVAAMRLPHHYTIVVVPEGHPRTKPRALNAGLEGARGSFAVVYDAEDRPDPGQLRAAVRHFERGPPALACLQARLVIDHANETFMTRMFALEYAGLFHVVKPGLAALGLPMPLGGTSNHLRVAALRRVGGWDSWNVTEDLDLGIRLARFGLRVQSLDSETSEEAPLTLRRWLPQRSRWLKGWMVTLLVLCRRPRRVWRDLGPAGALWTATSLAATVASCLIGPPLLAWFLVELGLGRLSHPETALRAAVVAGSGGLAIGGVLALALPVALGLKRLGRLDLAVWIPCLPVYMLLVAAAGVRALVELGRDPQGWNKTEHGLARERVGPPGHRARGR